MMINDLMDTQHLIERNLRFVRLTVLRPCASDSAVDLRLSSENILAPAKDSDTVTGFEVFRSVGTPFPWIHAETSCGAQPKP
jgi:hypothetical protein